MRRHTARTLKAFNLIEQSSAAGLPETLKPRIPKLAQTICADMAREGYFFLEVPERE